MAGFGRSCRRGKLPAFGNGARGNGGAAVSLIGNGIVDRGLFPFRVEGHITIDFVWEGNALGKLGIEEPASEFISIAAWGAARDRGSIVHGLLLVSRAVVIDPRYGIFHYFKRPFRVKRHIVTRGIGEGNGHARAGLVGIPSAEDIAGTGGVGGARQGAARSKQIDVIGINSIMDDDTVDTRIIVPFRIEGRVRGDSHWERSGRLVFLVEVPAREHHAGISRSARRGDETARSIDDLGRNEGTALGIEGDGVALFVTRVFRV